MTLWQKTKRGHPGWCSLWLFLLVALVFAVSLEITGNYRADHVIGWFARIFCFLSGGTLFCILLCGGVLIADCDRWWKVQRRLK